MGVEVICAPPCILPLRFSIENIQGCVKLTSVSTQDFLDCAVSEPAELEIADPMLAVGPGAFSLSVVKSLTHHLYIPVMIYRYYTGGRDNEFGAGARRRVLHAGAHGKPTLSVHAEGA